VFRESCERRLEPGAVASWQVSLYEVGRHRAFTMALRPGSNNRANLWIYPSGLVAM
jgi:hypothetical protein